MSEKNNVALGMFKKDGVYKLATFRYDDEGNVELEEISVLNEDARISQDMFKVSVVKKGILGE